jgi:hypothetical protein
MPDLDTNLGRVVAALAGGETLTFAELAAVAEVDVGAARNAARRCVARGWALEYWVHSEARGRDISAVRLVNYGDGA